MHADLLSVPTQFKGYVDLVKHLELFDALHAANEHLLRTISTIEESDGEYRYQPGKWSIKEVLVHLMDAERIFAYRALRFARNDKTVLSTFEENDYVPHSNAHARTLTQLSNESKRLRDTTLDLYQSFSATMLGRKGISGQTEVSVGNLGFIIAGHEMHHTKILQERYRNKG